MGDRDAKRQRGARRPRARSDDVDDPLGAAGADARDDGREDDDDRGRAIDGDDDDDDDEARTRGREGTPTTTRQESREDERDATTGRARDGVWIRKARERADGGDRGARGEGEGEDE